MPADVGTPSAPALVSEAPLPTWPDFNRFWGVHPPGAVSVALRRGLVHAGSHGARAQVFAFDVTMKENPRIVARCRGAGLVNDSFVASFAFSDSEVFCAGWNNDGWGLTRPGVEADDAQPRNVILMFGDEQASTLRPGRPGEVGPR